jgi:predicted alpha/beta hydrolase
MREELIFVKAKDQVQVALWKYSKKENSSNILMIHGTFSDRKVFSLAVNYFVEQGYNCWVMEWRNHGLSDKVKSKFDFETVAHFDLKAVMDHLIYEERVRYFHCVTHSGGGICLTMLLCKNPEYQNNIMSATMFACQAFSASLSRKHQLRLHVAKAMTKVLGFIPGKKLKLGNHNETYNTMKQWFNWNLSKRFAGQFSDDYQQAMKSIHIPVYSVASEADTFIAPSKSCLIFMEQFANDNNQYHCFSLNHNNLENYGHSRVIYSRNAIKEIFPTVISWITAHHYQEVNIANLTNQPTIFEEVNQVFVSDAYQLIEDTESVFESDESELLEEGLLEEELV